MAASAVDYLRSPQAIRDRCENIFDHGLRGTLRHFAVALGEVDAAAAYVADVTRERYPDLDIPYHSRWNHFRAGGVDRVARLADAWADLDRHERARRHIELAVLSVLLDAGAGPTWRYREADTGVELGRSEGLAIASFQLYASGALTGDAGALAACRPETLAAGFQVTGDNPLVGVDGRAGLVNALGRAARALPGARVGGLYDQLRERAGDGPLPAADLLGAILGGLGSIWPGRIELGGDNLGDVWRHPLAGGDGDGAGLVPFHKLSQWLAYSLIEPLEWAGIAVTGVDDLTALAEYRNGGLLVDIGVLVPRHDGVTGAAHVPGDEVVVEWRALTVALIDRVADRVRGLLGAPNLALARILEGGTWAAGRKIARVRRLDGRPPIRLDSDGTVF